MTGPNFGNQDNGVSFAPTSAWGQKTPMSSWQAAQDNYGGVSILPVDVHSAAPGALGPFVQGLSQSLSDLPHTQGAGLDGPQKLDDIITPITYGVPKADGMVGSPHSYTHG